MSKKSLYRIEVAPLVILPLERSPLFSYASKNAISPGSLVRVPFGSRQIEGITYGCQELPGQVPTWMKYITHVTEEKLLTHDQRELALFISDEYFTPLGKVLKHFVPKRTKLTKKQSGEKTKNPSVRTTQEERILLKKLGGLSLKAPVFFDTFSVSSPDHFLLLLAKSRLRTQTLILVPEVTLIPKFEEKALLVFAKSNVAILHSKLAPSAYFEAWERIRSGMATVTIATRQGLFAPFKALGHIILSEEQDESYKQWDMSPRYQGKVVAEALARLSEASITFSSGTPSTETVCGIQEGKVVALTEALPHPPLGEKLTLINLKLERFRKNYSPLSEKLVVSIRDALSHQKQVLLYINRQGMSLFSVCENCKHIFRCPESGHALINTPNGYYQCLGCTYKTSLFPSCPECGGLSFRHIGFGTERIESEVKKLFPGARTFRADGQTMKKVGQVQKLYTEGTQGKIDILIGTQMVIKDPPLPNLSLVAMIDADSLLSWPNFRLDESLFQHLSRFVHLIERQDRGEVLLQTFHPEATFFKRAQGLTEKEFYEKVLSERKSLFYPPYSRLLSLHCQDKNEEKLLGQMGTLAESLETITAKEKEARFNLLEASRYLKRQKVFESSLLIRVPKDSPISSPLKAFLKHVSKTCIIDIDPLSLS